MTAIGRALLTNPRVLLLDEVSLGLSPIAIETLYDRLALLFDGSATVILVEQNLDRAMGVSERIVCMLEGRTRARRHQQRTDGARGRQRLFRAG